MARRFQRWPEWLPGSSGRGFFRAQWVRDARMILDGLAGRPPPPFTHRDARRCLRGCRSSTGEPDVCGPTWSLPDGRARRLRTEVVAPRRASPTSADRSGCSPTGEPDVCGPKWLSHETPPRSQAPVHRTTRRRASIEPLVGTKEDAGTDASAGHASDRAAPQEARPRSGFDQHPFTRFSSCPATRRR